MDFYSQENKIFITKLTQICNDYDRNLSELNLVSRIVKDNLTPAYDTLTLKHTKAQDRLDLAEGKLKELESHLPVMVE